MKLQISKPNDKQIRTERVFDAPRERVWRAHTDAELLARWWGRGNRLTIETLDVRPGGKWRFVEHAKDGDFKFSGEFRTVDAPSLLVQTFGWDDMKEKQIVNTSTFAAEGDKTRLVIVSQFASTEDRDAMLGYGMADGQEQSYQALEQLL